MNRKISIVGDETIYQRQTDDGQRIADWESFGQQIAQACREIALSGSSISDLAEKLDCIESLKCIVGANYYDLLSKIADDLKTMGGTI